MVEYIQILLMHIMSGGPDMVAILILLCGGLAWLGYHREKEYLKERQDLLDKFQKQQTLDRHDLLSIIDKYQQGQIGVIQAMNEIKVLIASLGAKI